MTARVTIGGKHWEVESWSVDEDSTPLIVGDTSGSVGSFLVALPYLGNVYEAYGASVVIEDDVRGRYVGTVDTVREVRAQGVWDLSGPSYLGRLNIYNVTAGPVVGTLIDAVRYYFGLAGIPEERWDIEPDIATKPVLAPGWEGELWLHLKQMLSANEVELSLVSGQILIRKPRGLQVLGGFETDLTPVFEETGLAQTVEVYCYNSREIKNEPIYPKLGLLDYDDIISFSSGELQEFDLELDVSVSDFEEPIQVTDMTEGDYTRSAFMVSTDNGRILTKEQFEGSGGYFKVELNDDRKSMKLWLRGPDKILERANEQERTDYDRTLSALESLVTQTETTFNNARNQVRTTAGKSLALVQNRTPKDSERHAVWVDTTSGKHVPKVWGKKDKRDQWVASSNTTLKNQAKAAGDALESWETAKRERDRHKERGLESDEGSLVTRFYLAGGIPNKDDTSPYRQFPALRIRGYGVEWTKEKFVFPTGVSSELTDNEVGETVDNPFIQDTDYVSRLGVRLAARYSLADLTLSGTSTHIQTTGYNGNSGIITYAEVQALYNGMTGTQVVADNPGSNQEHVDKMWARAAESGYYNTVGNAAGARFYDRGSAHWYRIRQATVESDLISWDAEVDTTHGDAEGLYTGMTYADVQELNEGLTYQQVIGKGLRH